VDGTATPILHVSQLAEALGLTPPAASPPGRDAADAAAILDAWLDRLRTTPWPALLEPTPARGRSLRNLTVNAFHPFELLPAAWASGEFDWRPEDDAEREAPLSGPDELIAFAEAAASGWRGFLDEHDLADTDPLVDTSRGAVPFSTIVAFQRWHAAYHYRQLLVVLGEPNRLDLLALDDLELPSDVF
jgi:hypothetical protein